MENNGNRYLMEILVRDLKNSDINRRWEAARLLGESGDDAVGILVPRLYDDDEGIRTMAVWALGRTGSRKAISHLERMLDDEDDMVRLAGEGALQRFQKQ